MRIVEDAFRSPSIAQMKRSNQVRFPGGKTVHTEAFHRALVAGLCAVIGCAGSLLLLFVLTPRAWVVSSHAFVIFLCICAFTAAAGAFGIASFRTIAASQRLLKLIGGLSGLVLGAAATIFAMEAGYLATVTAIQLVDLKPKQATTDRSGPDRRANVAVPGALYGAWWLARKVSDLVYRAPE